MLAEGHVAEGLFLGHELDDCFHRKVVNHKRKDLVKNDHIVKGTVRIICFNSMIFSEVLKGVTRKIRAVFSRKFE